MFRRDSAMRSPSGLPVRPGSDVARRSPVVPPPHHSWPEHSVPKDSGRDPARGGGRFRVPRTSLCADRIGFRGGSGGSGRCRRVEHLRNCTYERCDRYAMPSPLGENLPMPGTLSSESESSLAGMSACRHRSLDRAFKPSGAHAIRSEVSRIPRGAVCQAQARAELRAMPGCNGPQPNRRDTWIRLLECSRQIPRQRIRG